MIEEFTHNLVKPEPRKALDKSIIVHDIQPLNELTEEEKKAYYSQYSWNWVEAIYILQGFKPVFQISTEQVRSHFPIEFFYFSKALRIKGVGNRVEMAGEVTYEDTVENWQKFWQRFNNAPSTDIEPTENQTATAPPVQQGNAPKKKISINQDRDNDCKAWIESENPPTNKMTRTQVHECLKERDKDEERIKKLWSHGFPDWCRQQKIITFKTGKPKKQR
ncbi:MAG: hypothetical protein WBI40_04880 [Methylococcaceae bacterium]